MKIVSDKMKLHLIDSNRNIDQGFESALYKLVLNVSETSDVGNVINSM